MGNVTSYNVTGLTNATDYQTVVRAKYSSSNSQTSNMVAVRTSRTVSCGGSVPANATGNATTTYVQAWNGSAWTPTTNWTNGSSSATCGFACNSGYTWNGSVCQLNTQTASCNGSIPANATASTASTYTQTWNGSAYAPSGVSWSNGTATCGFACNSGYAWNGTACAAAS